MLLVFIATIFVSWFSRLPCCWDDGDEIRKSSNTTKLDVHRKIVIFLNTLQIAARLYLIVRVINILVF